MRQLVAFVVFGVFLSGPLGHAWLRFLNGHKTSLKGQSLILYKVRRPPSRAAHVINAYLRCGGDTFSSLPRPRAAAIPWCYYT